MSEPCKPAAPSTVDILNADLPKVRAILAQIEGLTPLGLVQLGQQIALARLSATKDKQGVFVIPGHNLAALGAIVREDIRKSQQRKPKAGDLEQIRQWLAEGRKRQFMCNRLRKSRAALDRQIAR
jgi:hypothetical protein